MSENVRVFYILQRIRTTINPARASITNARYLRYFEYSAVRDLGVGPKCDRNCAAHSKTPPFCTFLQHTPKDDRAEKRASFGVKSSFKLPDLNENLNG